MIKIFFSILLFYFCLFRLWAQPKDSIPNSQSSPYLIWERGESWKQKYGINWHFSQREAPEMSEQAEGNQYNIPDWMLETKQAKRLYLVHSNWAKDYFPPELTSAACVSLTPHYLFGNPSKTDYPLYRGNDVSRDYTRLFESMFCICSQKLQKLNLDLTPDDTTGLWGKEAILYTHWYGNCHGGKNPSRLWPRRIKRFVKAYPYVKGLIYTQWTQLMWPSAEYLKNVDTYFHCNDNLTYAIKHFTGLMPQVRYLFVHNIDDKAALAMLQELRETPHKLRIFYEGFNLPSFAAQIIETQHNLEMLVCRSIPPSNYNSLAKLRRLKVLALDTLTTSIDSTLRQLDSLDFLYTSGIENWTTLIQHPSLHYLKVSTRSSDFLKHKEEDIRNFLEGKSRVLVFHVRHDYMNCGPHATRQVFEHVLRLRAAGAIVLINGISAPGRDDMTFQRSLDKYTGNQLELFYAEYDLYFEVHREAIEQQVTNNLKAYQKNPLGKGILSELGILYEAEGKWHIDYGLYLIRSGILKQTESYRNYRWDQCRRGVDVID